MECSKCLHNRVCEHMKEYVKLTEEYSQPDSKVFELKIKCKFYQDNVTAQNSWRQQQIRAIEQYPLNPPWKFTGNLDV